MRRSISNRWTVAAGAAAGALVAAAIGLGGGARAAVPAKAAAAPIRCQEPGHKAITVVLIHGAWADPSSWAAELGELRKDGCAVRAADNPVQDLATDSEEVANFVTAIHGPVLLVGHSYGGAVITNAAAEAPNVIGLVYVDAYAPAMGESAAELDGKTSALSGHKPTSLFQLLPGARKGSSELLLKKSVFLNHFANDLPRSEASQLWASQTEASTLALESPSIHAAWKRLPSWYFISTGDQIITPQSEMMMAKRAGSHVTVFHGGSHLTLISHPAAVTATIGKALTALLASGH